MSGLLQLISICRQREIFHFITFQFGVFWFWVLHIRLWNNPDSTITYLLIIHIATWHFSTNKNLLNHKTSQCSDFLLQVSMDFATCYIFYLHLSAIRLFFHVTLTPNRPTVSYNGNIMSIPICRSGQESRGLDKESTWYYHMINCMLAAILISSWCFWCFVISYYIWY